MIEAKNINNKQTVINILNNLKTYNKNYIDLQEGSCEYEDACERIEEQLCEIDEALAGYEKINNDTLSNANIRMMLGYWNYLNGNCSLKAMIKILKKHSNKLLIDLD